MTAPPVTPARPASGIDATIEAMRAAAMMAKLGVFGPIPVRLDPSQVLAVLAHTRSETARADAERQAREAAERERDEARAALQRQRDDRRKAVFREAVTWLHDEARGMNDPWARRLLDSTAHGLGAYSARLLADHDREAVQAEGGGRAG